MGDASSETGNGGNRANSAEHSSRSIPNTSISPEKAGPSTDGVVLATLPESLRKNGNERLVCERCGAEVRSTAHPTQKPIALMRYLVRLVTMPEENHIIDPFMGSGSTGVACKAEGVDFTGIDIDEDYCEIARRRIGAD